MNPNAEAIITLRKMRRLAGWYVLRAEGAVLSNKQTGQFGMVPELLAPMESRGLMFELQRCGVTVERVPAKVAVPDMIRRLQEMAA